MEKTDWKQDDTFLARWLEDDVSPEEKEAFESTKEGQYYMSLKQASKDLKAPVYDLEKEWSRLKDNTNPSKTESRQIWLNPIVRRTVAASLILLVGAFFLLNSRSSIRADYGQQQLAKLPDGSEVRLNSGSVLSYTKWDWIWSRKVELQGEAYFNVIKGNKFEVFTEGGSVTVLGTSFNVRSRNNQLDVSCYSGRVLVSSGDVIQDLNPNMSISLDDGKILGVKLGQVATEPSWMKGIVRLQNVQFKEVIEELERTFDLKVENQDPSLDTLMFTGAFPNNPKVALKLVLEPLNISYSFEEQKRKLTIIGRNE